MAPTAKIDTKPPGTLPADFGEWDSGETQTPATLPDNFDGFDATPETGAAKTVAAQRSKGQAGGRIPGSRSSRSKSPVTAAALTGATIVVPSAQRKEVDFEPTSAVSKTSVKLKARFIAVGSILLLAMIALFMFLRPQQNSSSQKLAVVVQPQLVETQIKPSPATAAAPVAPKASMTTTVSDSQAESSSRVQPEMMNNQLAAPTRLSRDIRRGGGEQQAPTLSVAGMENIGGNSGDAIKSIFNGNKTPQVKIENRVVNISAGVAIGLLLRKATPVYPAIAKNARVEGTVVLTATISKTGMIEDLRVVSGPPMLRLPALDAVKTWRYKPYLLNNQPVAVATTVSVNFALGK